jgi:hypothetical protein
MKRVVLELDERSDPISGSIVGDGFVPGRFDGYMELIAALEVVRAGPLPDRTTKDTNQPTHRSGDE